MLCEYKMRVNNKAESKEAQELFKQLGYKLVECHRVGMVAVNDSEIYPDVIGNWDEYNGKELTLPQLRDLVTQITQTEQGLISGANALRALADGKDVEYFTDKWVGCDSKQLVVSWYLDDVYQFRIKPSTVKIEIEIPKPFEPKNNKSAWVLDSATPLGYKSIIHHVGCVHSACWRTEDEIKQVVSALRSALTTK